MQSLVLGGVIGALGGMVYAVGTGSAQPDQYQNANTFLAYTALILGGAATGARPGHRARCFFWFLISFVDSVLSALLIGDGRSISDTRSSPRPTSPTSASSSSASGSCC